MFGTSEVFGTNQVFDTSEETAGHPSVTTGVPLQTTKVDRLAEFVHHLGDVSLREARRAIHHTRPADHELDPLSIVAAALLELRRSSQQHQYIGA